MINLDDLPELPQWARYLTISPCGHMCLHSHEPTFYPTTNGLGVWISPGKEGGLSQAFRAKAPQSKLKRGVAGLYDIEEYK